jgi:lactoylglutathione lyase
MGRLHHANIRVTDPAASLRFYGALGLKHTGTCALGPGYTLLYLTDKEGLAIELVVNETTDPAYDRSPGSGHLGLEIDDLGAALGQLASLGVEPEAAPAHPAGRTDLNPVVFVRDPDGVRIELLQTPWPIPSDALPAELAYLETAP